VDALLAGDVVFFCGAGISAPQMPTFAGLVERCFIDLNVPMEPTEARSCEEGRFEEALGALRRRIVDPAELTRVVTDMLQPADGADLEHHRTMLRLSRDLDSRPIILTTNFDTLIERALAESAPLSAATLSFAGQALPLPGTSEFAGIIHLHGRVRDERLGLTQTPLVMTSADYGDAYMRSGWASRFLFDLVRCKTIVLVGYSAGDAPVRYFLNVLEADRERFRELKPVYALDGIKDGEVDADGEARWRALAVHPILYSATNDPAAGGAPHGVLWHDLTLLADLIERPKPTRRALASTILSKAYAETTADERDHVRWLFTKRNDLLDVAIAAIADSAWFDFFAAESLWTPGSASWIVVLLRHERGDELVGCRSAWQQGHRSRLLARATVSLRRMVAMELGTCRSGRVGGAVGSSTTGNGSFRAVQGGARA